MKYVDFSFIFQIYFLFINNRLEIYLITNDAFWRIAIIQHCTTMIHRFSTSKQYKHICNSSWLKQNKNVINFSLNLSIGIRSFLTCSYTQKMIEYYYTCKSFKIFELKCKWIWNICIYIWNVYRDGYDVISMLYLIISQF